MKPYIKVISLCIFLISSGKLSVAQELASSYKPKNKTEKLIMAKIYALPEIKEWFKEWYKTKDSKADLIISIPDSTSQDYEIEVGLNRLTLEKFDTYYRLYINPQTLKIYFCDILDEDSNNHITLKQWRYWRTKSGFQKLHYYKNGKLMLSKD